MAVRCIDTEHVDLGFGKRRNALLVVVRVDSRSGDPSLALVNHLKREVQLILDILSKHEVLQDPILAENRQHRLMPVHQSRIRRGKVRGPDKDIQLPLWDHPLLGTQILVYDRVVVPLRQQTEEDTGGIGDRKG